VPRVAVVFTGGTISMLADPVAGGNVPVLDGPAILSRAGDLGSIADVHPIDLGRTPASHFTFGRLLEIGATLGTLAADPAFDGLVVVQGTDTIEETAFCWDLLHAGPTPIVVTGAMRTPSEPGDDGPANLRDAILVAASSELRHQGVVVVLGGTIEAADDVVKSHATSVATFRSVNAGSLGHVDGQQVAVLRRRGRRRHLVTTRASERVELVTAMISSDGSLLDAAADSGAEGIVVAATGAGNTSPSMLAAARRAMARDIAVVLASRVPAGAVGTAYAFEGGGATWARAGAILAGHLPALKARVALALGLGAGLDRAGLAALLSDPPSDPLSS
jgi:L-asparaginase